MAESLHYAHESRNNSCREASPRRCRSSLGRRWESRRDSTRSIGREPSIEEVSTEAEGGGGGLQRVSAADDGASVAVAVPDEAELVVESGHRRHVGASRRGLTAARTAASGRADGAALCWAHSRVSGRRHPEFAAGGLRRTTHGTFNNTQAKKRSRTARAKQKAKQKAVALNPLRRQLQGSLEKTRGLVHVASTQQVRALARTGG